MVTEDYVNFEVAKLLKEKGFNEYTYAYYLPNASFYLSPREIDNKNLYAQGCVSAPTLQMAMKWLREVHKIEIRVIYDNDKLCWYGACNPMNEPSQILLGFGRKCKSYEEAAEAGIRYCLEKLI